MVTSDQVKGYIQASLPCEYIEVNGNDGQHFDAVIVSAAFVGVSMVKQHQLVYQALGDRMREEIHALSMKTYTPDAWSRR